MSPPRKEPLGTGETEELPHALPLRRALAETLGLPDALPPARDGLADAETVARTLPLSPGDLESLLQALVLGVDEAHGDEVIVPRTVRETEELAVEVKAAEKESPNIDGVRAEERLATASVLDAIALLVAASAPLPVAQELAVEDAEPPPRLPLEEAVGEASLLLLAEPRTLPETLTLMRGLTD